MTLSYNDLKNMKKGDVLYESGARGNIKFTVKEDPIEIVDGEYTQLKWIGVVDGYGEIDYLVTKGLMHYGPSIYKIPAYTGVPNIGF